MSEKRRGLSPDILKETKNIAIYTLVGCVVMLVVFYCLHQYKPETVPFDYTVVLGAVGGGLVAVLNFFLMGVMLQRATNTDEEKLARARVQASYTYRMLLQVGWVILAIVAPVFYFVAGMLPLLFPGMGIMLRGIIHRSRS